MEKVRKEKIMLYLGLIEILKCYGISRSMISLNKDLIKDYSFQPFELASLSMEIQEKLRVDLDFSDCPNLQVEAIVETIHKLMKGDQHVSFNGIKPKHLTNYLYESIDYRR